MNADGSDQSRLVAGFSPDWQPLVGPRREDYKNTSHFCKARARLPGRRRLRGSSTATTAAACRALSVGRSGSTAPTCARARGLAVGLDAVHAGSLGAVLEARAVRGRHLRAVAHQAHARRRGQLHAQRPVAGRRLVAHGERRSVSLGPEPEALRGRHRVHREEGVPGPQRAEHRRPVCLELVPQWLVHQEVRAQMAEGALVGHQAHRHAAGDADPDLVRVGAAQPDAPPAPRRGGPTRPGCAAEGGRGTAAGSSRTETGRGCCSRVPPCRSRSSTARFPCSHRPPGRPTAFPGRRA